MGGNGGPNGGNSAFVINDDNKIATSMSGNNEVRLFIIQVLNLMLMYQ